MNWDFPGAPGVKNPPANVADVGFVPGLGIKVSRAMGYKSARCNYWARALWSLHITTETQHSKKKKKPVNYLAVRNVSGMTSQAEDTVSAKALRQRWAWHILVLNF